MSMTSWSGRATTRRLRTCLLPGLADGREIDLAGRKLGLARFLAVDEDGGAGIEVLQAKRDAAARPLLGHADLALVPGRGQLAQFRAFPAWMGVDRLAIVLHVVVDARPAARHLEIAPAGRPARASAFSAGCHRQRPLMQIRSRVGVASRQACSRSQTARTPSGSGASSAAEAVPADPAATSSQTMQTILLFMHFVSKRFTIASPFARKQLIALNRRTSE